MYFISHLSWPVLVSTLVMLCCFLYLICKREKSVCFMLCLTILVDTCKFVSNPESFVNVVRYKAIHAVNKIDQFEF